MSECKFTRRRLLELGGFVGAGALLGVGSGCEVGPVRTTPNLRYLEAPPSHQLGRVSFAFLRDASFDDVCRQVVGRVDDLSWLSQGDSVFLKLAINSWRHHPSVTAPNAIRAVVRMLRDAGAGEIFAGDQSGVEHVRLTSEGRLSSTRTLMAGNGVLQAIEDSGATLHNFDDQGWDGYFQPEPDFPTAWDPLPWVPNIIREVDHIVYVPRLSTHAAAGYTAGIKTSVGWLRDDSRRQLHHEGDRFFERFTEVNHFPAIRDKLRLIVTVCDHALLNIGPDIGSVTPLDGVVGLASTSLVDHDALVAALLPWYDERHRSFFDLYNLYPEHVNYWNRRFVLETWGEDLGPSYQNIVPQWPREGIEHDRQVSHLAFLESERRERIAILTSTEAMPCALQNYLSSYAHGLFAV